MQENFETALAHVLVHEGGFVDHPDDPGGATNKGVTLMTFRRFYGAERTVGDLKAITNEQLGRIYREGYWDACRCDQLPAGVDYCVFDAAVNSGPRRAVRWLEGAVGRPVSGTIADDTVREAGRREPSLVIDRMCDTRMAFLRSLRHFATFGRGWTRRVEGVRGVAKAMAFDGPEGGRPAATPVTVVRRGSTGDWVRKLQEALGITADGDFGPQTEAALRAFQEAEGIAVDGVAGPVTYRALGLIA